MVNADFAERTMKIFFSLVVACMLFSCKAEKLDPSQAGEIAYYKLRQNVFNTDSIRDAFEQIRSAKKNDSTNLWLRMAESEFLLIDAYTVGDWFDSNTFDSDKLNASLALANEAYRSDSMNSYACSHLAGIYLSKMQPKKSFEYLKRAHSLDPTNFYSYLYLGVIYRKYYNPKDALIHFEQGKLYTKNHTQEMAILVNEAETYGLLKDYSKEEELLLKRLKIDSANAYAHESYGNFLLRQGRVHEAIATFQKGLTYKSYPNLHYLLRLAIAKRDSIERHRI